MPESIVIPLTKGLVTVIDPEDAYLLQWKWLALGAPGLRYAARNTPKRERPVVIYMHRLIMGISDHRKVDHEDNDKLNNRRYNLRIATHKENTRNVKLRSTNTSGFKGVHLNSCGNYFAMITVDGKGINLGTHGKDPRNAARAYNEAALKYFGEFACLNEIPEGVE